MAVLDRPLTDRIADAATDVIRRHQRSIDRYPDEVKSVVIELSVKRDSHGGAIVDTADCYVQRRISTSAVLGLGGPKTGGTA